MTKKIYRRYSPEFKRHALKRASEDSVTDKGICEDLARQMNDDLQQLQRSHIAIVEHNFAMR